MGLNSGFGVIFMCLVSYHDPQVQNRSYAKKKSPEPLDTWFCDWAASTQVFTSTGYPPPTKEA